MKHIKLISLLASILFLSSSSCSKEEPCGIHYLFEIPFTVTPIQDTINIGDTIWLESKIPHEIEDKNTGKKIKVGDFNYFNELNIFELEQGSFNYLEGGGHNNFVIIPIVGNTNPLFLADNLVYEQLIYENTGDQQDLKIGLVAMKKGIFGFTFNSNYHFKVHADYFSREVEFQDGECTEILFTTFKMNDGTFNTNNFYILKKSNVTDNAKWKDEQYINEGAFTFVVE